MPASEPEKEKHCCCVSPSLQKRNAAPDYRTSEEDYRIVADPVLSLLLRRSLRGLRSPLEKGVTATVAGVVQFAEEEEGYQNFLLCLVAERGEEEEEPRLFGFVSGLGPFQVSLTRLKKPRSKARKRKRSADVSNTPAPIRSKID